MSSLFQGLQGLIQNATLDKRNRLNAEYGKALNCNERALFYAEALPDGFPLKIKDFGLGDSIKPDQTNTRANVVEICANINNLYSLSGLMLYIRLGTAIATYAKLADQVSNTERPERSKSMTLDSTNIIRSRFKALHDSIDIDIRKSSNIVHLVNDCSSAWEGLNNMCRLFMDEITYLSVRIDDLNNRLETKESLNKAEESLLNAEVSLEASQKSLANAEESLKASRTSLAYAVWGIAISAALTLLSIVYSVLSDAADNGANQNPVTLQAELKKLTEKTEVLQKIAEGGTEHP